MTHGSQHRLREPSKTFYSAYSGLRPNEDCPKIPFPENRGEVGKAFEYLSWGGVSKVSPVDGADDDENAKIDAAFLGALHIIRTNVDGDYKRRVLPGELAECFFKAPEGQWLTYRSFKAGPVLTASITRHFTNQLPLHDRFSDHRAAGAPDIPA